MYTETVVKIAITALLIAILSTYLIKCSKENDYGLSDTFSIEKYEVEDVVKSKSVKRRSRYEDYYLLFESGDIEPVQFEKFMKVNVGDTITRIKYR